MTARWLLDHNPDPAEAEIREAISGQVCRCTGYDNIVRSVRWAADFERSGRGCGVSRHDARERVAWPASRVRAAAPQGGPAVHPRPGHLYVDDRPPARACSTGRVLRSPHPHARILSVDTVAVRGPPEGQGWRHPTGETLASLNLAWMPTLSPATRRPCSPPTRSGSRARRWRSSSPRTATPRGTRSSFDRGGLRAAARGGRRAPRAGHPARAAHPRRPAGAHHEPHLRLGGRATPRATEEVFRDAEVIVAQDMLYLAAPPRAARDVRRGRGLRPGNRQADHLGDHPGPARLHRTLYAMKPACSSTRSG